LALCERALEEDTENVRALAILGVRSMARITGNASDDPKAELRKADEFTTRALAVDPNNYLPHYARAMFLASERPEEAKVEAERTLALNPSFVPTYVAFFLASWSDGQP
jgi:hypothetical protein